MGDRLSLRERAEMLYRSLGDRISVRPPDMYEDLVSWILRIQRLHLEELRPRDRSVRDRPTWDRPVRDQPSRDQLSRDQPSRDRLWDRTYDRSAWQDSVMLPDGSRVPVYSESEIRAMSRLALREHASLLSAKLGPERIGY